MLFLLLGIGALFLAGHSSGGGGTGLSGDLVTRVVAKACIQERDTRILIKLRDLCSGAGKTALASALEARLLELQPMASVAAAQEQGSVQTFGGILGGALQGPAPAPVQQAQVVTRVNALALRR